METTAPPAPINVTLEFDNLKDFLPNFARHATNVVATDIYLIHPGTAFQGSLTVGTTNTPFDSAPAIGKLNSLSINGTQTSLSQWKMDFTGVSPELGGCWLLVRYAILTL